MNYLDKIAENFTTLEGMEYWSILYQYKIICDYFIGKAALELGCADGAFTEMLIEDFEEITVIDGSSILLNRLKERLDKKKNVNKKKIYLINGFFEDVELEMSYDTIVMGHVLEHLDNPVSVLRKYKKYLKKDGVIIITVPNAKSFHRIAATKMNLLNSIYDLNETDLRLGHKRVYDLNKLKEDIKEAGLELIAQDGYWLKFLSNKQLMEQYNEEVIKAYMEMGREFIENAAEIVAVCR